MRYLLILLCLFSSQAVAENSELKIIGWIENVKIMPENFELTAKIDTGADNSSLDVTDLQNFTRQGKEWLRFKVMSNNEKIQTFERPLKRYTHIKRKRAEPIKRPVVTMQLCLGGHTYLTPVNLATRKDFKYRMLIGRSFLKGRFLVDSAAKKTQLEKCQSQ